MTDQDGYILHKNQTKSQEPKRYHQQQLELMNTHQLREICRQEKLINGMLYPPDKEALIAVIMRFRGIKGHHLIRKWQEDGFERLQAMLDGCHQKIKTLETMNGCSRIILYEHLAVTALDQLQIKADPVFAQTNVLLISHERELCGIFNLESNEVGSQVLYLTKDADQICHESMIKDYSFYLVDQKTSQWFYDVYYGISPARPDHLDIQKLPVLNVELHQPPETSSPLVIDFGSSNTVCGLYRDQAFCEQNNVVHGAAEGITYVRVADPGNHGQYSPLMPTVVGIAAIAGDDIAYLFGHEALALAQSSYIDQGFCVFYDLKQWIDDCEKEEELTDRQGKRCFVKRTTILSAFFQYTIGLAEQQFKCHFQQLQITCPYKQKQKWLDLYQTLLPQYSINREILLDETVAILYNTIYSAIEQGDYTDAQEYQALVMDCGGSSNNLTSCRYTIENRRVSYKIKIDTAYENGDTDLSGNHLTYRIMQLLKILIAGEFTDLDLPDIHTLMDLFEGDLYRLVDQQGMAACYASFEQYYQLAEDVIPTSYAAFEHRSKTAYYKVKNNFYFLFDLARQIKHYFSDRDDARRLVLSTEPLHEAEVVEIPVDKWKLSIWQEGSLEAMKYCPTIYLTGYQINQLLKADVYQLVKKFLEADFDSGGLNDYDLFKITGQSGKMPLFREAIKEFIPGKVLNFSPIGQEEDRYYKSKLECINGALKYLYHQKMGYTQTIISSQIPALPYKITALTHDGLEQTLIYQLDREKTKGHISRNMAHITLKLYLKDTDDHLRCTYTYDCRPSDFTDTTYAELAQEFGEIIPQDDTDNIIEGEIKCFVWSDQRQWGFYVLPVLRTQEQLKTGIRTFYPFESETWVVNYFDGTK